MKEKRHFDVYARKAMDADEEENCFVTDWELVGSTDAVSEKQAINNVRYRTIGNHSQYMPVVLECHYAEWLEWKAI